MLEPADPVTQMDRCGPEALSRLGRFEAAVRLCFLSRAALANLHLDEYHLAVGRVDDVMFHPLQPGVTLPRAQLRLPVALRCLEEKFAVRLRHHDIVMPVNMPAGLGARCKSPLGDYHAFIEYLLRWNCLRTIHERFLGEVGNEVSRVSAEDDLRIATSRDYHLETAQP